jgi:hypothetical protein
MGRNIRALTRSEKSITLMTVLFLTSLFFLFSIVFGLLALYILKSALGINIFEGFSLGLWGWLQQIFE